jgi:hypothetical protein
VKDLKAALGSNIKPDITHVRTSLKVYVARNCEYGNDKYVRSNYLRPVGSLKEAFERYRSYLRAVDSHLSQTLDAMERHQATDPNLEDESGMCMAAYAADTDETPGAKVGASGLPHIGGCAASLNMAIEQAVLAGLLPPDPGQPWKWLCAGLTGGEWTLRDVSESPEPEPPEPVATSRYGRSPEHTPCLCIPNVYGRHAPGCHNA